jgi:transposase
MGRSAVASKPQKEERWSARKKADAVVRLLRGEGLDEVSQELRVEAHRLQAWRDEFLAGGIEASSRSRSNLRNASSGGAKGRRAHARE